VGTAGSAVGAVFGKLNVRAIASDMPIDFPTMITNFRSQEAAHESRLS